MHPFVLLTAEQTRQAEEKAMGNGIAGAQLMERAGGAVVQLIGHIVQQQVEAEAQGTQPIHNSAPTQDAISRPPVAILCGPGNNGGDGFVIARLLAEEGWTVRLGLMGDKDKLKGDAALMAGLYEGAIEPLSPAMLEGAGLVIDAILGTGLTRSIDGALAEMIQAVNTHPAPVIAVDIPTGIHADTGAIMGVAVQANRTLTFVTRKPGHVLYPGRAFCGVTDIAAIGIANEIIGGLQPNLAINDIALWGQMWPRLQPMSHKYKRGAVAVLSGGVSRTGAARLAARGALRIGAGIVTILSPPSAVLVNANHLTAIMIKSVDGAAQIATHLSDDRISAVVAGPGLGLDERLKGKILTVLKANATAILDADALTGFAEAPEELFEALRPTDILTPHEGEFSRLFPQINIEEYGRLKAAKMASEKCGCILVLKGADTIIAAPDGRTGINVNAPPGLATAGSGDVLAGFIAGLVGQRHPDGSTMPSFEAAMAGVWFHGAVGQQIGPGMIAEDLPEAVPGVLRKIFNADG